MDHGTFGRTSGLAPYAAYSPATAGINSVTVPGVPDDRSLPPVLLPPELEDRCLPPRGRIESAIAPSCTGSTCPTCKSWSIAPGPHVSLFDPVPSRKNSVDRCGAPELAGVATEVEGFGYLEIGSYFGGALQVLLRIDGEHTDEAALPRVRLLQGRDGRHSGDRAFWPRAGARSVARWCSPERELFYP